MDKEGEEDRGRKGRGFKKEGRFFKEEERGIRIVRGKMRSRKWWRGGESTGLDIVL